MTSTTLICKRCKAPLEYEEGSDVARCPHCGYTELIDESDMIKRERIRAKAYTEAELGKHKIEKDADVEKKRILLSEKNLDIKKIKYIILSGVIVALIVAAVLIVVQVKHRGKLRMPMSVSSYCGIQYDYVEKLLQDAGFSDITSEVIMTLSKDQQSRRGEVTQVSIGGTTAFRRGQWFPKDTSVVIHYLDIDPAREKDIQIPMSSDECSDMTYSAVIIKLIDAGFSDITLVPQYDFKKSDGFKPDMILSISIAGNERFSRSFVSPNSDIRITYCAQKHEYIGEKYQDVEAALRSMGFFTVNLIPMNDLQPNQLKKTDVVESVSIGRFEWSDAKEYNLSSPIYIKYHSEQQAAEGQIKLSLSSKELEGENYQEVVKVLTEMGFSNVQIKALEDLSRDVFRQDGEVKTISINGETKFSSGSIVDANGEVIVSYHSLKPVSTPAPTAVPTETQISVMLSSKELSGKNYSDVLNILKEMGFTNIRSVGLGDLKKGWLYKEGNVKTVSIGDATKFSVGDIFEKDVEVVISYHSFPES